MRQVVKRHRGKHMEMEPNQHTEKLPLTETTFFILLSLAPKPKHGYSIMKDVAVLSAQRLHLSTGTLYGALKRLLDQGWIERQDVRADSQRDLKIYALTELGRHRLNVELTRLQH